jgi:hypothetical protein
MVDADASELAYQRATDPPQTKHRIMAQAIGIISVFIATTNLENALR